MMTSGLGSLWEFVSWLLLVVFIFDKAVGQTNIRLVPGNVNCTNCGRLEVLINGKWGTVCSNLWTETDARVACRQLHFLSGGKPAKYGAFGEGRGPIHMSHVDCNGNETSLSQCPRRGGASCGHDDDAGVICESDSTAKRTGSVRLEDGNSPVSGRVAIQYHGVWGTVCRNGWNMWNSRVVCRSLGFCGGSSVIHDYGAFGLGTGPVWLTQIKCDGSEQSLEQCHHAGWGNNSCDHGYDVGVVCELCSTGMIRLKGGTDNSTGIVTISNNGIWGTVCSANWSDEEARVVCKSLGFGDGLSIANSNFTSQTGSIWLSEVDCTGLETGITKCRHDNSLSGGWGSNNCRHYQDVAVQCVTVSDTSTTSTTISGSTISNRTVYRTTTQSTTVKEGSTMAHGMDKTWIIIIAAVIAALITVTVVAVIYGVIKMKASNSKSSLMLNARGQPNDYMLTDNNDPDPCTTSLVRMPEKNRRNGKPRDSGVYEEIEDEEETIDIQQPGRVRYHSPTVPQSRQPKYNRKTTPLPDVPEESEAVSVSPPGGSGITHGQRPKEASLYLEPRNLKH